MAHADIGLFEERLAKKARLKRDPMGETIRGSKPVRAFVQETGKYPTPLEYKQFVKTRAALAPAHEPSIAAQRRVATEVSGDMGTTQIARASAGRRGGYGATTGATQAAIGGGGAADIAGGGLVGLGAATGNPYALAAGLGLQVIGAGARRRSSERKQAQRLEYEAKLERISRQQKALDRLVNIGQGLRNL